MYLFLQVCLWIYLVFVTCAAAMKAVSHKEIETKTKKTLAVVSK